MKLDFFVSGRPVPKSRPRVLPNGHVYTEQRTADWEETVGWDALQAMKARGLQVTDEPVDVTLRFWKARKTADTDNLAKAVLDAMNDIVYTDDRLVVGLRVFRMDDPDHQSGVSVSVREAAEL